jgi:hypothetical protein
VWKHNACVRSLTWLSYLRDRELATDLNNPKTG